MADELQNQNPEVVETPQQEVARMMELSLNMGIPHETISQTTDNSQNQGQAANQGEPPLTVTPVVDIFTPFKEKYGYENPEAAMADIEQLRAFRASPTVAEIKFENEQSEKVYKALQAGKMKEVYEMLAQQENLTKYTTGDVTEETAAEIIKLGMGLKYKDLSQDEINYKFNKQYALPKEPVQKVDEDEDDFNERKQAWQEQVADIKMNKMIDAKLSRPDLEAAKAKLVLPEPEAIVDNGYLQYKKSLEERPKIDAATAEAYKQITPESLETKLGFNDEANKVQFEFQYRPDGEDLKKAVEYVTDIDKFYALFIKPDGKPDREKFLKAIDFAVNGEKIVLAALNQSKNATIKANLPDNSQGGLVRQLNAQTQEPSELDKMMQASGVRKI